MTRRKRPASAALATRLERETIDWIRATETAHWSAMVRVWHHWLPGLPQAAQERILVAMLREAAARREAWPADLVAGFAYPDARASARQAVARPHPHAGSFPRGRQLSGGRHVMERHRRRSRRAAADCPSLGTRADFARFEFLRASRSAARRNAARKAATLRGMARRANRKAH